MPPIPLDERIVVHQRPKSSPLHVGSPQTTFQQPHSASLRNHPPPSKPHPQPQPQLRQSRQHLSSSSSSSERRRRSSRSRKSKGRQTGEEYSDPSTQPSDGLVVLKPGQHRHTHTIDIKVSLTDRTREQGTLSLKQQVGHVGHSGSLKGNKEKKVSLRLDLGHGEKKAIASGKAEEAVQEFQSHPQSKKKAAQHGTNQREHFTLSSREAHGFQFTFQKDQEQDPENHSVASSFSSRVLREVLCAGNKENSKLGPIHQPSNPHCPPHQHNSAHVPHTSVLNVHHPGPLSSQNTASFHHQLSQLRLSHGQEHPPPHLHAAPSTCSSSRGGTFPSPDHTCTHGLAHPFSCGCWKLVHSRPGYQGGGRLGVGGRGSGVMGLKTLGGCLSTSSTTNTSSSNSTVSECRAGLLRPLGCVSCSSGRSSFESPAGFRKKLVGGCLPCAPLSSSAPLRVLQSCVGGCNPKASQTGSSTCSYCSSDPIVVTYNPHRGKMGGGVHSGGGVLADDDDYSVRTIWPEELAKKMTRSKDQQNRDTIGMGQGSINVCDIQQQNGTSGTSPVVLDCRNLLKFTRSQLTDHAGRRCLQQGKMAVLDFIGSGSGRDVGRDSLKRLWTKEGEPSRGLTGDNTSPSSPPSSSPTTRSPASFSPPPSAHTTLTKPVDREGGHCPSSHTLPTAQPLQLVLNSLNREQDEENKKAHQSDPHLSLPLSAFLPSSLSAEEGEMSPDVENAPLSPILPFLFLGNERDAQDLELLLQLNVGFVVNVTTHLPLYHLDSGLIRYKRLPATDSSKQNLRQYFEEVFEFIEEAHQSGRGVMVHCQAGVSRSATIVIAYLMKHTLMTMMDAYKYVRSRRPVVSPNLNFMGQLLEFERDLNSGVTPRILTPKLSGLETQV